MTSGPPAGPDEDELTMWSHSLPRKHEITVQGLWWVFFVVVVVLVLFFLFAGS